MLAIYLAMHLLYDTFVLKEDNRRRGKKKRKCIRGKILLYGSSITLPLSRFMKLHGWCGVLCGYRPAHFKQDIAFEDDKPEMMHGLYEMIRTK